MGRTFGEARRLFDGATLIGLINKTSKVPFLNPPDDAVVGSDDLAVFLTADDTQQPIRTEPWEVGVGRKQTQV